jgi:hypothetical protein
MSRKATTVDFQSTTPEPPRLAARTVQFGPQGQAAPVHARSPVLCRSNASSTHARRFSSREIEMQRYARAACMAGRSNLVQDMHFFGEHCQASITNGAPAAPPSAWADQSESAHEQFGIFLVSDESELGDIPATHSQKLKPSSCL